MSTPNLDRLGSNGIYDVVTTQLLAMGSSGLSEASYGTNFVPSAHDWSGNISYLAPSTGMNYKTTLIGEIRPSADGTLVSARGNHFVGGTEEVRKITDDIKVKDVLVLGCPTDVPQKLKVLYDNQLGMLNEVRESDLKKEGQLRQKPVVKEWLRQSTPDPDDPWEYIVVPLPLKYTTYPYTDTLPSKRRIGKHNNKDDEIRVDLSTKPKKFPHGKEIFLGALYEPSLSPDYGGPLFDHNLSKLHQLDICDTGYELIPPWETYEKLKPGTLVLIEATLHCFKPEDRKIPRKIYQINAHSVRVLASSDAPVERREIYSGYVGTASASLQSVASKEFVNFSVPTPPKKKQKAM